MTDDKLPEYIETWEQLEEYIALLKWEFIRREYNEHFPRAKSTKKDSEN